MRDILPIVGTVLLVVAGQLLLKLGMTRVGVIDGPRLRRPLALVRDVALQPAVVTGFVLYGLSAAGWIVVLSRFDLSFAYPFLALSYVGVTVAAVLLLRERLSAAQWLGIALVAAGVLLVAVSGGR